MANMQVLSFTIFCSFLLSFHCERARFFSENYPSLISDVVGNYWTDSPLSMLPIYHELILAGIRIWVFRYEKVIIKIYEL